MKRKRKREEITPLLLTEEQMAAVQDAYDAEAFVIIGLFQKARREGKQQQARALWELWNQFRAGEREFHAEQAELQRQADTPPSVCGGNCAPRRRRKSAKSV